MKKLAMRIISIFLVIILFTGSLPIGSFAATVDSSEELTESVDITETSEDNYFTYEIDKDNNASITGYNGDEYFVTIPDIIDNRSVTSIADNAFANNGKVIEVALPDSLISIGGKSFANCKQLHTILIPASVENIADDAFESSPCLNVICFNNSAARDFAKAKNIPYAITRNSEESFVEGEVSDAIEYRVNLVSGLLTIYGTGNMPNYSSNSTKPWSENLEDITGIAITEGITTIGNYAFSGCNGTTDFAKTTETDEDGNLWKVNTANVVSTEFGYNEKGNISTLKNTLNALSQVYGYGYDKNGNITTETLTTTSKGEQGETVETTEATTYTYDEDGQLKTAENSSTKWEYSYDGRGNILSKSETDLTTNEAITDSYTYDTKWLDKLTSYNNQSIVYDNIGNPTEYLGHNLEWSFGRQLTKFDDNVYTYNEDGIRTSKTVDGVKTTYYLDGSKPTEQQRSTSSMISTVK